MIYRPRLKEAPAAEGAVEVTVKGDKPPREVTRRVLEQREIQMIPGTNGDALRAIEKRTCPASRGRRASPAC